MNNLGLTYEACKEINPKIIYASLKGFAQDGPCTSITRHLTRSQPTPVLWF